MEKIYLNHSLNIMLKVSNKFNIIYEDNISEIRWRKITMEDPLIQKYFYNK